jgi:hypothetical protein
LSGGGGAAVAELFVVGFVGVNALALGGAAWLYRGGGRNQDWAFSLGLSTAATAPGVLLICETSVRLIAHQYASSVAEFPPSTFTQWFCWLWGLFMGPVLFLGAFLVRSKATPPRVYALQLVQLVEWGWSILMMLLVSLMH